QELPVRRQVAPERRRSRSARQAIERGAQLGAGGRAVQLVQEERAASKSRRPGAFWCERRRCAHELCDPQLKCPERFTVVVGRALALADLLHDPLLDRRAQRQDLFIFGSAAALLPTLAPGVPECIAVQQRRPAGDGVTPVSRQLWLVLRWLGSRRAQRVDV